MSADTFLDNPPGSATAVTLGCSCPQEENNFGRGRMKSGHFGYVADAECPIHGIDLLLKIIEQQDWLKASGYERPRRQLFERLCHERRRHRRDVWRFRV